MMSLSAGGRGLKLATACGRFAASSRSPQGGAD